MTALINLIGHKFGSWKVLTRGPNKNGQPCWVCRCVCGTKRVIIAANLRRGFSKSCGCKINYHTGPRRMKHGHAAGSQSTTYVTWQKMKTRCYNRKHERYADYGGRGIRVCKRWRKFENFLKDMGERPPGKTIDRKNPNGHYTPANCRWATRKQQTANRRAA